VAADLPEAIAARLADALPALFGGATPVVRTEVTGDALELVAGTADAAASDPRPADQRDVLAFDGAHPGGPYELSRSPYPGPRRVWLQTAGGNVALSDQEVRWDATDPRRFTLAPRPSRDLGAVTGVEVLFGITSVFATLAATRRLELSLATADADAGRLGEALALMLAAVELNRDALVAAAAPTYQGGDYGAQSRLRRLRLVGATAPQPAQRLVALEADVLLRVDRSLRDDEGTPIARIASPGRAPVAGRPVDVAIEVDA
jgi:hypothetical protein